MRVFKSFNPIVAGPRVCTQVYGEYSSPKNLCQHKNIKNNFDWEMIGNKKIFFEGLMFTLF